jgi:hypothetical protein
MRYFREVRTQGGCNVDHPARKRAGYADAGRLRGLSEAAQAAFGRP